MKEWLALRWIGCVERGRKREWASIGRGEWAVSQSG